jgi:hypothetical protein
MKILKCCRNDRYQPWKFWSYEHNKCVFKKSLCSEEGQLIYSNGTYMVDRSCHCDYTKGYVFVKPPLHQCYCVPSWEECGCLLKQCPNANYVLSQGISCDESTTDIMKTDESFGRCLKTLPLEVGKRALNPAFSRVRLTVRSQLQTIRSPR